MNGPLVVAGALALLGAGIHGIGGQLLVVRRLSPDVLPASPFGGPRMTKTMIQAAWHLTTVAFVAVGVALLVSGSVVHGDTARGMAAVGAGAATGFAAVVLALGAASVPRSVLRHPAPALLTAVAALAWWGTLSGV